MDEFIQGYIACALWTTTDENGEPCDMLSEDDIAPETLEKMRADATDFWKSNWSLIMGNPSQAGHDFWLTRNGHGAGFWDGDWPQHGETLTQASTVYGGHDLMFD